MIPFVQDADFTLWQGDVREVLASLPAESVHMVCTSPPYWSLRDYGVAGQLGLEATPEEYVANMVAVFREVRRVMRKDATCWLNLGDSYSGGGGFSPDAPSNQGTLGVRGNRNASVRFTSASRASAPGLKPKDLVGIPWRVAFALQQPYYAGTIRNELDRVWLAAMPTPETVRERALSPAPEPARRRVSPGERLGEILDLGNLDAPEQRARPYDQETDR